MAFIMRNRRCFRQYRIVCDWRSMVAMEMLSYALLTDALSLHIQIVADFFVTLLQVERQHLLWGQPNRDGR